MSIPSRAQILAAVMLLAACGDGESPAAKPKWSVSASVEEVRAALDPKRAELEAVRAKLDKAIEAAKQHPPLTRMASVPSDPKSVLVTDESQQKYDPKALYCVGYDTREDLLHQVTKPYAVRQLDLERIVERIPSALAVTHALVCRTTRLDPLVLDNKAKSFTGGHYQGECRLFELQETKYLGGFSLNQGMPEKLRYGGHTATPSSFSGELGTEATAALRNAVWGKTLDSGSGIGCNFPE